MPAPHYTRAYKIFHALTHAHALAIFSTPRRGLIIPFFAFSTAGVAPEALGSTSARIFAVRGFRVYKRTGLRTERASERARYVRGNEIRFSRAPPSTRECLDLTGGVTR